MSDSIRNNWQLLPYDLGDSATHFVLSEALVRRGTVPSIWWHASDEPALVLGAGQAKLDVSAARGAGVKIVRRSAGGTAVFAGPDVLGQDVFLPAGHPLAPQDVVETYRWLGETWLAALTSFGVGGHLVSIEEARAQPPVEPSVAMACFGSLSPFEVTVEGRKLVGLAQVRRANGVLLQAGIHLTFDAQGLADVLPAENRPDLAYKLAAAAIGLNEIVPEAGVLDVMDSFHRALRNRFRISLAPGDWSELDVEPGELTTSS
jgi:lipoate-protein ligase A